MPPSRALVLSGGGVTGIAWCLGLLHGLQMEGADVTNADLLVGTSAGATVGALVAGGTPLDELVAIQKGPAESSGEISIDLDNDRDLNGGLLRIAEVLEGVTDPTEILAGIGKVALETPTAPESVRRAAIASRLQVHTWPDRPLLMTAVDAESGEWRTFDRTSGPSIVDAIAASSSVPCIWPPVTIDGHRYMDGGVRSLTNADVAAGMDRVLVLVQRAMADVDRARLDEELVSLGSQAESLILEVDESSRAAMGPNPLDVHFRGDSARAGQVQGSKVATLVSQFWDGA